MTFSLDWLKNIYQDSHEKLFKCRKCFESFGTEREKHESEGHKTTFGGPVSLSTHERAKKHTFMMEMESELSAKKSVYSDL